MKPFRAFQFNVLFCFERMSLNVILFVVFYNSHYCQQKKKCEKYEWDIFMFL